MRLHETLEDPAARDEALTILRGLVERVVVHPGEPKMPFEIELVAEIANMLPSFPGQNSSGKSHIAVR